MSWGEFFYPHCVLVRDLLPGGGMGDRYGPARSLRAEVRDTQTMVRDADGREVVSSTLVTVPLPDHVPLGSLVTVWPGTPREREARVLSVSANPNADPLDDFLLLSLE